MKHFTIKNVLDACQGTLIGDSAVLDTELSSIVTDSRKVKNGTLFAAVKGERVDGHSFVNACFDNGAVCALCEHKIENADKSYIIVKNTLHALKQIARAYRLTFDIPFIGISGSVGKTSTKEMLSVVLSQKFKVHKTSGNFNNELGVPLTLFELEPYHEIAVIEMGISDFSEMTRLSEMVRPDVCVITNIGCCHLENLGDRDGVLKAKTEMFENMNKNGTVFLNGDDDKLSTVKVVNGKSPIFFGIDKSNDYYADDIDNTSFGIIRCNICDKNEKMPVAIPAIGTYMVTNSLAAVAVGKYFGMTNEQIINGIASYKTISGRANVIKANGITILDDCYNANPASMKGAIETISKADTRKVCILGDMKELGKDEALLHTQIADIINTNNVDVLITVGLLAKNIYDAADLKNKYCYEDLTSALEEILQIVRNGDTVLVKASHSMKFENIVKLLQNGTKA